MKQTLFLAILLNFAFGCSGQDDPSSAQDRADAGPKMRQVTDIGYSGSISYDGRVLMYVDGYLAERGLEDHVFVFNLKTQERRRLTKAGTGEAGVAALSADGKVIAYEWVNPIGFRELRTMGIDGTGDKIIYSDPIVSNWLDSMEWSPSGSHILGIIRLTAGIYEIVLVSVADGSLRVLSNMDFYPEWGKVSFSPDGSNVAFDMPAEKGSRQRDIFMIPTDGGREIPLVTDSANDLFLAWTPDGKRVLFLSDRSGTWDAWIQSVVAGKPQGAPKLVKPEMGSIESSIGFTRDGSYYFSRPGWMNDVYLAAFDPDSGMLGKPEKLISDVGYETSALWSTDGQNLAYVLGDGYPIVLGVRSDETGEEHRFQLKMTRFGTHSVNPQWSPDGRHVLAQGRDLEYKQGLYSIDARTGKVAPVIQTETYCPPDCVEWPVWSRDGSVFFIQWLDGAKAIMVQDPETGRVKELYRAVSPESVAHLAVSPDAQRLGFFWRDSLKGSAALKVIPAKGGEVRELTKLPAPELSNYGQSVFELAWTPDSHRLIYTSTSAGQNRFEFWSISVAGGEPENLGIAMEGLLPYGLSIHPDGQRIAFTAGTPPREDVWVMEDFLPALKH